MDTGTCFTGLASRNSCTARISQDGRVESPNSEARRLLIDSSAEIFCSIRALPLLDPFQTCSGAKRSSANQIANLRSDSSET
jgi:hypothetical protein